MTYVESLRVSDFERRRRRTGWAPAAWAPARTGAPAVFYHAAPVLLIHRGAFERQMAAAILDIDLAAEIRPPADLDPYTDAFVLIRFGGVPVGHCWLPIRNGQLDRGELLARAVAASEGALSRRWFERELGWTDAAGTRELPSATVAICTRDRPDDLARALAAVTRAAGADHPILIVDNRPSSDAARQLVTGRYPHVRYVREDTPGLNAARNRALAEAATDIVAFTDDDAAPEVGWLEALRRAFDHRLIMGVTGITLPSELETPAQEWFERSSPFGRGYFRHEFDPLECSPHAAGQVGAGANMALRRSVVDLVGPFDERLDAGTPTLSGGDHEMFSRLLGRGYRLVYEPTAVSWHRHRRSWPELRQTLRGYGTGVYAMWTGQLVERGDLSVLKQAAWWFFKVQAPLLLRAIARRPDAPPLDLVLAELDGCAKGPLRWLASHRARRRAAA
jgi:GT2 family glycosyltransferase